jgi:hypothetical protein
VKTEPKKPAEAMPKLAARIDELGAATHKSPKSLMRMLAPSGNPQAANLFAIVAYLQESKGLRLTTRSARR